MMKNKKIKKEKNNSAIFCDTKSPIKTFWGKIMQNYKANVFKWWMIFILILGTCIFIPLFSIGFWIFFTTPGTETYNLDEIIGLSLILLGLIGQMFLFGGLCIAMMWHSAKK